MPGKVRKELQGDSGMKSTSNQMSARYRRGYKKAIRLLDTRRNMNVDRVGKAMRRNEEGLERTGMRARLLQGGETESFEIMGKGKSEDLG